jgi:tRNA(fMet)-specific endonuclease VapC
MVARYILDTNICIYIRSRRPPELRGRLQRLEPGEAVLSVITYGELIFGVERSRGRDIALRQLADLATAIPVLSLPDAAATAYGRVRATLERSGQIIGSNDLWIAAHALAADLVLITNNEREFGRVAGLKIENWTSTA